MAMSGSGMRDFVFAKLDSSGAYSGMNQTEKDTAKEQLLPICEGIVEYIQDNAEVKTTLDQSLNTIFVGGAPVPGDGGTALQAAWTASTSSGIKDNATGVIE